MPSPETLSEARRVMTLCNACRYCEGFCAVFQAMELRTVFADEDLTYLSHLCHDCRGCYYACQYAPPHEFDINVPQVFAQLRLQSYRDSTRPRAWASLLGSPGRTALLATVASLVALLLARWVAIPGLALFRPHRGPGAFYEVVPYGVMVGGAALLGAGVIVAWWASAASAGWTSSGAGLSALTGGAWDAVRLTYLGGGGDGCTYPSERASRRRRALHHLVVGGFALDLAATAVAAFYHHFLRLEAPYPLWSVPVVLGSLGGIGLIGGTVGLLTLRRHSDPDPESPAARALDLPFLWLLLLTALSGFAVLFLRDTAAMGPSLVLHLAIVGALFFTMPYGKLVHAVHRFGALTRWHRERAES